MKYLVLLLLLFVTPLFGDGTDLLQKQSDGSVEINSTNAWAIARGLCPKFDPLLNNSESAANTIWGDLLGSISDNFARHAALAKYVSELDDASARAKTVTNVTYAFGVGIGDYDFSAKAFPFGPVWTCVAARTTNNLTGISTCVAFDQALATSIPVPEEDKARALQTFITSRRHGLVAVVHGTIKGADQAYHNVAPFPAPIPGITDTENYRGGANYRIIISLTSVDYHLGDAKGPVLCTQTFGASPSLSPLVLPPTSSPTP
ncbi:MAG TPA: hypothetical protein VL981_05180 [Candidatus Methylacidiphilales bacterium]|nr:hypothetical protein [Candidatus Methylacidiphilales bacterium]